MIIRSPVPHWRFFTRNYPQFCKLTSATVAVLMGGQPCTLQIFEGPYCINCLSRELDHSCHVLFNCVSLEVKRNLCIEKIRKAMPIAMWEDFVKMQDLSKTSLMLSGFQCQYTKEWNNLYIEVVKFVYSMYSLSRELYDVSQKGVT